ncbi:hypothetical protein GWK36_03765 [Caldichromatium japonicum]|uniref:Uncharacterized protein n=1 Tax=Caldichromatium japonicum TaxID=2699430 RepID=A0A6G7VBC6_9GAMM|nr:hypothetical protein [Caldichromatium japonicum]QIK37252.1 hypothetical protein GWK36_03765 [Caldichromatium japonicum]
MNVQRTALIASFSALILSLVSIGLQLAQRATPGVPVDGGQVEAKGPVSASEAPSAMTAGTPKSSPSDPRLDEQARRIEALERQLAQVARAVHASGLDAAAPLLAGSPGSESLLTTLGEQYAARARFEENRQRLTERAAQMRQRDRKTYGEADYQHLTELSKKALPRRGAETEAERAEREAALNNLIANYPESWATSVTLAEQALDAAMNRNAKNAEMYYQSLLSLSPYEEIVTEQGIDAIPTLQTYLARQYLQEGRTEDAATLIEALSAQGDRLIIEPNEMGEPVTRSVSEIVADLRQRMGTQTQH